MNIASRVHQEIMNLPCKEKHWAAGLLEGAYKIGHKEARYAAAEIAQHAIAELERENAELRESVLNLAQGDIHFCNSSLGNLLLERVTELRAERIEEPTK